MKTIKKLFLGVTVIICISGILISFLVLYPRRYDDNLHIKDISGDSSVLKDITIKGVLSDEIQRTNFSYKDGILQKTFSYVRDKSIDNYNYQQNNYTGLPIFKDFYFPEDADKKVNTYTDERGYKVTETTANKSGFALKIGGMTIKTDVIYYRPYKQTWTEYGNGAASSSAGIGGGTGIDEHTLTPLEISGERTYIYTTTGSASSGFGGVYDITGLSERREYETTNIAPIDLKDGAVEIVGMKASESWLVFITVENDKVILKPFNLKSKEFTGDISIGSLPEGVKSNILYEDSDKYSLEISRVFYSAVLQDDEFFNIEIKQKGDGSKSYFYTIALNQNKIVLSFEESASYFDSSKGQFTYSDNSPKTFMKYKNNRLHILRSYLQTSALTGRSGTIPLNSVHISVYENEKNVYQGEIVSAAEDDYIHQNLDLSREYGRIYVRSYYYLEID